MKQLEKHPESKVKIRFPDCDPFNHLNNSRYIDYFLNAREDHLLSYYDLDIHAMARKQGISWVVAQNQVAYLAPAMLMETVVIQTRLLASDEKTLLLEALMWDEQKTVLKAILWCTFVHYDLKTKRSLFHSDELMTLLKQIQNPYNGPMNFENRVRSMKETEGVVKA